MFTHNDVISEEAECDCATALDDPPSFTDDCFSIPVEDGHGLECIEFPRSVVYQLDACGLSKWCMFVCRHTADGGRSVHYN